MFQNAMATDGERTSPLTPLFRLLRVGREVAQRRQAGPPVSARTARRTGGVSGLVTHGSFRTLDLSPFRYERIQRSQPFLEEAVI